MLDSAADKICAYECDPFLRELDTRIIATGGEQGRPWVILEDTLLYPEGGGQGRDHGTLAGVEVLDLVKTPEGLRHVLASPLPPGPVRMVLDWTRRFDHMQQHTGQHLLTALAQDRFGWATTAFHMGGERCDIELDCPPPSAEALAELEEDVAAAIRAALPVSARRVSPEDYAALQARVRSRGLPEGHQGDIRLVEIQDLDLNTCGGTHLSSTAQIECIKLLGTEPLRGGTRLFFVAGARARRRFQAHEQRSLVLRTLLGAPDEGLVEALEQKLGQLQGAERHRRHLEETLAATLCEALAAQPGVLAEQHLEGQDVAFLQSLGRALALAAPAKAALLTAHREGQQGFVLAAGAESGLDLKALGPQVAALLEGRGGGNAPVFQGRAGSLARRDEALERVRAALEGA